MTRTIQKMKPGNSGRKDLKSIDEQLSPIKIQGDRLDAGLLSMSEK